MHCAFFVKEIFLGSFFDGKPRVFFVWFLMIFFGACGMGKQNEWKQFAGVLVLVILLVAAALVVFFNKAYAFEFNEKSTVFYSNDSSIMTGLQAFSQNHGFLVATQFFELDPVNQFMANGVNLFSVVLIGNQKKAVNVFMIVSPQTHELLSCRTNYGEPSKDEAITAQQCEELVGQFAGGKILLFLPDASLSKTQVILKANSIEIHPSSAENLGVAVYSTLKKMFSNTDEIIGTVNDLAGQINKK